jgi:WD40 repeat protein/mono/diheme cytochrome c family protein
MRSAIAAGFVGLFLVSTVGAAEPDHALAQKAQAVLKANCYRCHGQDGVFEGGMNFILDSAKLVSRKKIVPGKPEESRLFQRVLKGTMPPADQQPRPSDADKEILKQWIAAGAPTAIPADAPRTLVTQADLNRWMLDDLETLDRRARRFVRYFSLAHLYNQGLGDDELQTYRNALSKLANSLSWHPKISLPVPVDPHKVLLRIDLRWYMWDSTQWNRLLAEYPYGVLDDGAASRAVMVGTATKLPLLRADWFVANASRPPLYFDMLQLPTNLPELEKQLRVDAATNIQQERVARCGFNGSGISKNNRILERHDSVHGAYWRSYDFEAVPQNLTERGNLLPDKRNVFAYPLGPVVPPGSESFQSIAGEVIFSLPNGLHGFMLVNANGVRVEKGLAAIVSDPKRPDRAVETGVSCIGCHLSGINVKSDQVRDFVAKNPKTFSRTEVEVIRALYPPEATMKKLMDDDIEKYRKAVEQAGAKVSKTEPVSTLTLRYEADLDLETAAAEAGVTPEEFRQKISASEALTRNLGSLRVAGGTISRQIFVQTFGDVVRELKMGALFAANNNGGILADNTGDLDPLESQGAQTNHAAFTHDGRLALLASADRSVRLFDVTAVRDLKRFVGHTASVWSVAFSPDEKRALSGSMDGTVRLWDVASGQEIKRFDGHLTLVAAVAFSADGKFGLSGGYDGAVVLWDLTTNKEVRRFDGVAKYVHALAFLPDGKHAFIGSDKTPKIIDLETGKEIRAFPGHTAPVTSVAVSGNGKWALTGSDDRTARLWNLETGKATLTLPGHDGPVRDVAFAPSGKAILTASADQTVRLWDRGSGKLLAPFKQHAAAVVRAAFIDGGRLTISAGRDSVLKLWPLKKFEDLTVVAATPDGPTVPTSVQAPVIPPLKPIETISIGGTIGNLILSPNRKWLFLLNRTDGHLVQIDTSTLKVTRKLKLLDGCEVFTLTPNGKTLATFAPDGDRTAVSLIDAIPLSLRVTVRVEANPHDIAMTDGGLIFLTGGGGGWADVAVMDLAKASIVGRWGGVWNNSLVRLSADQKRVYVASQGVNPGKVEGFPIPVKLDEKPTPTVAPAADLPLGGPFAVTPDGQFAILQNGTALHLSQNASDDLHGEEKLTPHLASAADADLGVLFLLAADGITIKQYSYPELKWQKDHRLGVLAHQMALDAKTGRLYLAVIDPKALRDRPRARGVGDIQVFESKEWVKK